VKDSWAGRKTVNNQWINQSIYKALSPYISIFSDSCPPRRSPFAMFSFYNEFFNKVVRIHTLKMAYITNISSILFLKNGLKKICRKNYKDHLRSNNYEVCSAVAHCVSNILDVMVLENINLSEDKTERLEGNYCQIFTFLFYIFYFNFLFLNHYFSILISKRYFLYYILFPS
jgi:hypothetical protein